MTKLNKQQSSDLWFITDLAGFAPTEVLDLGTKNGNTLRFFQTWDGKSFIDRPLPSGKLT